jgi:hypothetical protein
MLGADLSKLLIRLMELAEMSAQTALAWIHVYHPQYLQELEAQLRKLFAPSGSFSAGWL